MTTRRAPDRPRHPIYGETLEGHRFELYQDSDAGLIQLYVDGHLTRQYEPGFRIFRHVLDDILREWEVSPSREIWPGV